MCDFMYVDTQTMPVEDYFTDTKIFVVNYKKIPTPGPVPKHWRGLSYIRSKEIQLDQHFYDTELKGNQTTHPTIRIFLPTILLCL